MKVLIFVALLALAHCSDTANTPGILIGTWSVSSSYVKSSSDCCMPSGTMKIVDNYNNSVTVTSTSWTGSLCRGRSSTFKLTVNGIDGSDSWNELAPGGWLYLENSLYQDISEISISFSGGQDTLYMDVDYYSDSTCVGYWTKSAKWLSLTGATLVTALIALFM